MFAGYLVFLSSFVGWISLASTAVWLKYFSARPPQDGVGDLATFAVLLFIASGVTAAIIGEVTEKRRKERRPS